MATNEALVASKSGSSAAPVRRDDVVLEELDGAAILYDPRYGAIHRFNAVTLFVWDMCDGSHSVEDIASQLTQLSETTADSATESVQRVIAELRTLDLLKSAPAEPVNKKTVPCWTESPPQQPAKSANPDVAEAPPMRLSRRRLLTCGATKIVFVAPVISTFFATGAYASGRTTSAYCADGLKNVGFSCTNNPDCCDEDTGKTACDNSTDLCCIRNNQSGCIDDSDCCDERICVASTCIN